MKKTIKLLALIGCAAMLFACEEEPIDTTVVITTAAVSEITDNSAVSGGEITNDGGSKITAYGVCLSTKETPTIADSKTEDGTGTGKFTSEITDLNVGTIYYVRAYAQNANGVWYGNAVQFTTLSTVPVVTTTAMSNVTYETAVSGGVIVADGGEEITACGVCWATSENPDLNGLYTIDEAVDGTFVSEIDGLEPDMKYYVRAYATNKNGTAYGTQISFSTSTEPVVEVADAALQAYLIENFDLSNDAKLQESEAAEVFAIEAPDRGIASLAGIEKLVNLKELRVQFNSLTEADLSGNKALEAFWAFNNTGLTTINTTGLENLKYIHAYETALSSIDPTDNIQLVELNIHHSNITEVNVASNPQLAVLALQFTGVKNIDVSNHTALTGLWADNSPLETLNIKGCTNLVECYVQQSRVQNVDASGLENLKFMWCWERNAEVSGGVVNVDGCKSLTHLFAQASHWDSVSVTGCESLQVFNAYWTNTDVLDISALKNVTEINLDGAPLTSFNPSAANNPALIYLNIHGNRLSSLDLKNMPALKQLHCGNSSIESLNVSGCNVLEEAYVMNNSLLTAADFSNLPALRVVWEFNNAAMTQTSFDGCAKLYYVDMNSSPVSCNLNFVDMPELWQTICWGTNVGKVTYKNTPALEHFNFEDINKWEGRSLSELVLEGNFDALLNAILVNCGVTSLKFDNCPKLWYLAFRDSVNCTSVTLNTPALTELWAFTCNLSTVDVTGCADVMNVVNLDNNVNLTTLYKRAGQTIVSLSKPATCNVVER